MGQALSEELWLPILISACNSLLTISSTFSGLCTGNSWLELPHAKPEK